MNIKGLLIFINGVASRVQKVHTTIYYIKLYNNIIKLIFHTSRASSTDSNPDGQGKACIRVHAHYISFKTELSIKSTLFLIVLKSM